MDSMSCRPCKGVECEELDDETEEYEALSDLYKRLFEPLADEGGRPIDGGGGGGGGSTRCECTRPAPSVTAAAATTTMMDKKPAAGHVPEHWNCADSVQDESRIKRVDRQLMALMQWQSGGNDDGGGESSGAGSGRSGDVKHLTDRLPEFKSCKGHNPSAVNAALFGLDLEHWLTAAVSTSGDGRDESIKRAAYDLAAAEAHCKHGGAVKAAELAVQVEPSGHLAEVAARFGAQSYAATDNVDQRGAGRDSGDNTPVVVVAYVGSTGDDHDQPIREPCSPDKP